MTPNQASKVAITACIMVFCAMFFFHLGRMTTSTVTLRSGCDLTDGDRSGLKPSWYRTGESR